MGFLADLFRREPDGPCGFEMPDARALQALQAEQQVREALRALPPPGLVYHGPHADRARELWGLLPPKVRALRVGMFECLDEDDTEAKRNLKGKWLGYLYYRSLTGVVLWSDLTFLHEVGHAGHIRLATAPWWADWELHVKVNRSRIPEKGRKNAAEAFAEVFAHLYAPDGLTIDSVTAGKIRGLLE
jgi:hypothetical protein